MLDFRKVLLALSVAGLGLVGTASAQITCAAPGQGVTPGLRAEGVTEQLGTVAVTSCTGTTDTTSVTFLVTTNAPVTNVFLTGSTTITDAVGVWSGNGAIVYGTLTSSNSLSFTFAVPSATTFSASGTFTFSNIRVNATTLPASTAYTATVSGGGTNGGVIISAPTAIAAGISQKSLGTISFIGYANVAICGVKSTDVNAVGVVQIRDNFSTAFTTDGQEYNKEVATGGPAPAATPTISGTQYTNPVTQASTVGTRIAVTFGNLANGATYYLPVSVASTSGLILNLVPAAASPCGGTAGVCASVLAGGSIGTSSVGNTSTATVSGVYGYTPTGGSFTAYYAVVSSSYGANTDATFLPTSVNAVATPNEVVLYEVVPSVTIATPGSAPTVTLAVVGNSANYAQFGTPAAPYAAVTAAASTSITGSSTGYLTPCNTTLLFPYLVTSVGYDTGIAIANTGLGVSTVPGNIFTATATGSCTMTLYGAGSVNGTAVTPIVLPAVTVVSGQTNAFTLSGALPTTQPTFVGYGVASCSFIGAHAFAQISNGSQGFSEGYLAPILSDIFTGSYTVLNPAF